jgi:hypothetical protein
MNPETLTLDGGPLSGYRLGEAHPAVDATDPLEGMQSTRAQTPAHAYQAAQWRVKCSAILFDGTIWMSADTHRRHAEMLRDWADDLCADSRPTLKEHVDIVRLAMLWYDTAQQHILLARALEGRS